MKYFITIIGFFLANFGFSQTAGTMTFSVKTVTYPAPYSPRHLLAIWISDGGGTWIKTRKFMSQTIAYRQYLTSFKNATNFTYNATDAITGATLQSHQTHTITWDGKNVSGSLVPDGTYRVYIEFTSANATGKIYYCEFTKGPDTFTLTPANMTFFQDISVSWTPTATTTENKDLKSDGIVCYPNPFSEKLYIKNIPTAAPNIRIVDLTGRVIRILNSPSDKNGCVEWDGRNEEGRVVPPGIYMISCNNGTSTQAVKIIRH
jgi:flagellar hook assembly protein FlgD